MPNKDAPCTISILSKAPGLKECEFSFPELLWKIKNSLALSGISIAIVSMLALSKNIRIFFNTSFIDAPGTPQLWTGLFSCFERM